MFKYTRQPNVYVIGDLHIGEFNMLKLARPQFETREQHNEYLIQKME